MISKQKLNYLYLREILMLMLKRSANIKRTRRDGEHGKEKRLYITARTFVTIERWTVMPTTSTLKKSPPAILWMHPSFRADCLLVSGLLLSSALCQVKNNVMPWRPVCLSVLLLGFCNTQLNFPRMAENEHGC